MNKPISAIIHDISTRSLTRDLLFICKNEVDAQNCYNLAKYFSPNINAFYFPAWDTIAYDRVSPSKNIMSQRAMVLSWLSRKKCSCIIFVAAASLLQKLPPIEEFKDRYIEINAPSAHSIEDIALCLVNNGFIRTVAATEPGEFAQKGEIFDFVVSQEEAYRLTFAWHKLEQIKILDPLSQISNEKINKVEIHPSSEMNFSKETIEYFKAEFLKLFTVNHANHPIYQAITEGRYMAGCEQLIALCYPNMIGIWDYLNKPDIISSEMVTQIIKEEYTAIEDFYSARIANNQSNPLQFYPVFAPERFYFSSEELLSFLGRQELMDPRVKPEDDGRSQDNGRSEDDIPNFYAESISTSKTIGCLAKEFFESNKGKKIHIFCSTASVIEKVKYILGIENIDTQKINFPKLVLPTSFMSKEAVYIKSEDLIGQKKIYEKTSANKKFKNILQELETFEEGDLVVHEEHGIGKFIGVENITVLGIRHDCIKLAYDSDDKLYIPVENIDSVKKYGSEEAPLDRLGSVSWQKRKAKFKNRIGELAQKLIAIAAARKTIYLDPIDTKNTNYDKFCNMFPYSETEDQLSAIADIEHDLSENYPMDRMICGDVGFGKTEVAMRAAFLVASSGKQVAIVAPTTILSRQHHNNFIERFANTNLKIAQLSRLTPRREVPNIVNAIKNGKLDIIIGTHALLAESVKFHDLGMMIIDEEQHFGVMQKERLKELKSDIHALSLSATPIPRTLQMSMIGIRDLSLIATPPIDRLSVRTNVIPNDPVIIRDALMREHMRGGRSFYVAPRIKDLEDIEKMLKSLVPELKFVIAHGKMPASNIDQIMTEFYDGKFDILLCTTIIESGIDVPNANTIIIHKSEILGLSQLYQLRGRVGRGKLRGFAYLIINNSKTMTQNATKRLDIIENINNLGAGFTIASYDSDIRGFGNLVGDEQSGHIREVGTELYQEMLELAILDLQNKKPEESLNPNINLNIAIYIPDEYIEDGEQRLAIYKRISTLSSNDEIEQFNDELIDRFGIIPLPTLNLLALMRIKLLCKKLKISDLDSGPNGIVIKFIPSETIAESIMRFVSKNPRNIKLRPDNKLSILFSAKDEVILEKIHTILLEILAL